MTPIEKLSRQSIKKMETCFVALPWEDKWTYAEWLAQTFFYVRHATRVLAKAAYRCSFEDEGLHKKLLEGINEEKNHEIMTIRDMAGLGFDIGRFHEFPETSAYYQTLYHLIDVNGPYELLGYFVTLEGLGALGCHDVYERVALAHGEKSGTFIKVHTKLDARHFEDGMEYINSLDKKNTATVKHGIEISTELYCNMIKKVTTSVATANNKTLIKKAA